MELNIDIKGNSKNVNLKSGETTSRTNTSSM